MLGAVIGLELSVKGSVGMSLTTCALRGDKATSSAFRTGVCASFAGERA